MLDRLRLWLNDPIDGASLVAWRICFGIIVAWEARHGFSREGIFGDWITRYWIEPSFHFTYHGFGWVTPLPSAGMYAVVALMGLAAGAMIVGAAYRVAALVVALALSYTFLLEQSCYLNHMYLIALVSWIMVAVPIERCGSVFPRRGWTRASCTAPRWSLVLLRFQIGLVYVFGGIAKLNSDWLRGKPLDVWMKDLAETRIVGPLFEGPTMSLIFSYGGLLIDLGIVPLLLWKPTRALGVILLVAFHHLNAWIYDIGAFPWFMLAATTLFFSPDWPRRWIRVGDRVTSTEPDPQTPPHGDAPSHPPRSGIGRATAALLLAYAAFQVLMPLRHWVYSGNVAWTDEGHRFSWRMKLRDKRGSVRFEVVDLGSGERWTVRPRALIQGWQERQMSTRPDMIVQLAAHIAETARVDGHDSVAVYAHTDVRLNGRPPAALIDPRVDLSRESRSIGPASWITSHPDD